MCLSIVTSNTQKPKARGHFYKVFQIKRNGQLYSRTFGHSRPRIPGQEYRAALALVGTHWCGPCGTCYTAGFHGWTNRKAATSLWLRQLGTVVRRVAWRHELTRGRQDGMNVIVAKYMTIVPLKGDK